MLSETVIKRVLEETLENEYWRDVYENAPTEKCKRYWALTFCGSAGIEGEISDRQLDEADKECDEVEKTLGIEDWEYIMKYCGSWQYKAVCKKKIEELKARGGQ